MSNFKIIQKILFGISKKEIETPLKEKEISFSLIIDEISKRKKQRRKKDIAIISILSSAAAALLILIFIQFGFFRDDKNGVESLLAFDIVTKEEALLSTASIWLYNSLNDSVEIEDGAIIQSDNSGNLKINSSNILKTETNGFNQLYVPRGKRANIQLSDGSTIMVNSSTHIIFPTRFAKDKKEIYVNGEAYFNIIRDVANPSVVKTSEGFEIKVLGTTFGVCTSNRISESYVVLEKGLLNVSTNTNNVVLRPNQLVNISNSNLSELKDIDVWEYIGWTKKMLVLKTDALDNIIHRLNVYYGSNVEISPELQKKKISGKIELKDDIQDVLIGLSIIIPAKIEKENDKYKLTEN